MDERIDLYDGHGKLVRIFLSKNRLDKATTLKLDIGDVTPGGYEVSMNIGTK